MTTKEDAHSDGHVKGVGEEELKHYFPHLYQEYIARTGRKKEGGMKQRIDVLKDPFRGYIPTYKDFLARARTYEECEEIIEYLYSTGEISNKLFNNLMKKLKREGPEGFGTREDNYYSKFTKHH